MPIQTDINYLEWCSELDLILLRMVRGNVSQMRDLPEPDLREMFDDGVTAQEAAEEILHMAKTARGE